MKSIKLLSILLLCLSLSSGLFAAKSKKSDTKIVAVYDIEGLISESGLNQGGLFGPPERPLTHYDIVQSLTKAADDEKVAAVVIDFGGAGLKLAQIQEIARCLQTLRAAEKDVWVYTEQLSNGMALLGAPANHFTLMPEANVTFTGLHSESLYFKGMLDKMGMQVDVIHIGDFKSAGESLYRTEPSEYSLQQNTAMLDSLYQQLIQQVAGHRQLTTEQVENFINHNNPTAQLAKELGLVDQLMYRTSFNKAVKETYGEDADYNQTYQLPDIYGPEIKSFMDVVKLMFQSDKNKKSKDGYIGVVALEGAISDKSIAPVRREIIKLSQDENCKALVLRVDSPGGSALSSDVLWEATTAFKATERPFVVSMGSVAASGGYYVSAAADRIFAEPGTITGSIGVVGMKLVLQGSMDKLGITSHSQQRGKNAGIMTSSKPFSPAEADLIRQSMLQVYSTFKKRITDGRGDRLQGELEKLAGGRVYTGQQALDIGLVDQLGGLNQAIAYAAEQAGISADSSILTPAPKSPLEGMFSSQRPDKGDELIGMSLARQNFTEFAQAHPALRILSAPHLQQVDQAIKQLESINSHHIQLLSPTLHIQP